MESSDRSAFVGGGNAVSYQKLWLGFGVVVALSFLTLGYYGLELYRQAPPIPDRVLTSDGDVLFTGQEIRDGQNAWQSMGGQEVGSVWGHGAYVAPDWSADWLHREAEAWIEGEARREYATSAVAIDRDKRALLEARLQGQIRANTYDAASGNIVVTPARAAAVRKVAGHYEALFGTDPALGDLRKAYAIPFNAVPDAERRRNISAFFFWTSWACATNRPGSEITYTQNWPPDAVVGNRPTGSIILWSIVSCVALLAGIGALSWNMARTRHQEDDHTVPDRDPLRAITITPSMRATIKYFWTVTALCVVQVVLGGITAHYGVEGGGFYGFALDQYLPYAVTRTWHTQLGIFWIATAWLATGLFVAPAVAGGEPRHQRLGVNVLFGAILIVVVGSLAGQWMGVMQKLGLVENFWFGHQGYEYVDLGRFWQIALFSGLAIWLALMLRALAPALRKASEHRSLLGMFTVACGAIVLFYGAGLMWGRQTHLALAEYWRWWVVHLWVEGFFEVFATVVIAFLFSSLGLIRVVTATRSVLFSTTIFLSGGIIGTFHHLYFTGTPTAILALGATFSALEIVPLVLVGFEACENMGLLRTRAWVSDYKWPIYFFVAVAFWNLVGAGLFGFLINPPIALYYMQGLNTTPVHGHTALFGVYGMLGIGLMLFCLRAYTAGRAWNDRIISFSFWSLNVGISMMVLLSLLPIGLLQAKASMQHGLWFARSAEFLQTPLMQTLRWMRVPGDIIFSLGMVSLAVFVGGLWTGWSYASSRSGKAIWSSVEAETAA